MANDYHWRSTKAKQQLRDRFGRWISLGANVRFRADGQEQAGVVTSVINGKAYVDQKNLDGTVTKRILEAGDMRVLASKATLPPDGTKINAVNNSFSDSLKSADYAKAMQDKGSALIQRTDGYALAAAYQNKTQGLDNKTLDGTENVNDKTGGNPVLYQLYAPGGRSLGQYSEGAEGDFDSMVDSDKADTAPSGSGEAAPAAPSAPIAASIEVVGEEKPYRVPEAVKTEIATTISSLSTDLPEADLAVANRLANDNTVSLSDVQWVHGFFAENELSERLRGGFKGRKWASKIVEPTFSLEDPEDTLLPHPKYMFDDDKFVYFAVGPDSGSPFVDRLIAVDYETGEVSAWGPDGFLILEGVDIQSVDEPQLIPIDEMTADVLAHWIDSQASEAYNVLDTNPEERNLFTLAEAEIDFEELHRVYSIIAAGAGDGEYTPIERSQNAQKQGRAAGGRFGETPDATKTAPAQGQAKPAVKKGRLPVALPMVQDPAARISEWISSAAEAPMVSAQPPAPDAGAPVTAAGEPTDAPAADSGTPEYTQEDQATEDAATGPKDEALYFAIVDAVDKTAVMDAVAIVKQNGAPAAYIRANGKWTASPDTLAALQGSTPPPVVELPDPETVKNVIQQIDEHDSGADQTEVTDQMAPQPGEVPVAASGYALPDGSYTIIDEEDLQNAVVASAGTSDIFVKAHIRKRARVLNRMDIVPAEWRQFSLAEIGELSAAQTVYGEYGEIIVAAGVPGVADAPSDFKNVERLKTYWRTGKGALKIRWGTPGDLTRAHRHLSKYVGPEMAWGLAQNLHKDLFGVPNITHDRATGQYKPRKK